MATDRIYSDYGCLDDEERMHALETRQSGCGGGRVLVCIRCGGVRNDFSGPAAWARAASEVSVLNLESLGLDVFQTLDLPYGWQAQAEYRGAVLYQGPADRRFEAWAAGYVAGRLSNGRKES